MNKSEYIKTICKVWDVEKPPCLQCHDASFTHCLKGFDCKAFRNFSAHGRFRTFDVGKLKRHILHERTSELFLSGMYGEDELKNNSKKAKAYIYAIKETKWLLSEYPTITSEELNEFIQNITLINKEWQKNRRLVIGEPIPNLLKDRPFKIRYYE